MYLYRAIQDPHAYIIFCLVPLNGGCDGGPTLYDAIAHKTLPEHVRTGSLPVEKLLQQVRHRAAAATPLAAGVATRGIASTVATSWVATTAATTVAIGGGAAG